MEITQEEFSFLITRHKMYSPVRAGQQFTCSYTDLIHRLVTKGIYKVISSEYDHPYDVTIIEITDLGVTILDICEKKACGIPLSYGSKEKSDAFVMSDGMSAADYNQRESSGQLNCNDVMNQLLSVQPLHSNPDIRASIDFLMKHDVILSVTRDDE